MILIYQRNIIIKHYITLSYGLHVNTTRSCYAGSMQAHRLRRWPSIEPAYDESVVFTGNGYLLSAGWPCSAV